MAKGKGKAGSSRHRDGTRKIVQVQNQSLKSKPSKPPPSALMAASVGKTGIREETGGASGGGGSTKKSKKARPSDAGQAPGLGLAANKAGAAQQSVSSGEELFKMTCTCVHLVNHPGRDGLLRKLMDIRNEVGQLPSLNRAVLDPETTWPLSSTRHKYLNKAKEFLNRGLAPQCSLWYNIPGGDIKDLLPKRRYRGIFNNSPARTLFLHTKSFNILELSPQNFLM